MLSGLALLLFIVGVGVSLAGFKTNAAAQAAITKAAHASSAATTTTGSSDSSPPSTTPITLNDIKNYRVRATEARYITIPKLGTFARVLVAGTTKDGAMATPSNVFDTARYNGSAKPGQLGATLIDGHVSSWTTNGVFHDIKKLKVGDTIGIQRGDGKQFNYTVAQVVTYDADKVDMKALLQPIASVKSGLNLITCGGKYDSKSGEFTQRVAVFATLDQ
jgi:LPXTG-site transpeptidase (sortase) family protein